MTIPESTWEEARALRNAVNWNSNSSVKHIAHALHRARQEATQAGWQPIETAPAGKEILVCVTYNISSDEWETTQWVDWRAGECVWPVYKARIDIPCRPTHWRPLPEPPTVETPHD